VILPWVKAHLRPAVKSLKGQSGVPEGRRVECPQVRRGLEPRSGSQEEHPGARREMECRPGQDQDAQAEVPGWAHRAAAALGWACRTWPGSLIIKMLRFGTEDRRPLFRAASLLQDLFFSLCAPSTRSLYSQRRRAREPFKPEGASACESPVFVECRGYPAGRWLPRSPCGPCLAPRDRSLCRGHPGGGGVRHLCHLRHDE
jgi:hypothetical protein